VEENKQQDENNKWSEEKINSLVDDQVIKSSIKSRY
jgi:hypothetical protein